MPGRLFNPKREIPPCITDMESRFRRVENVPFSHCFVHLSLPRNHEIVPKNMHKAIKHARDAPDRVFGRIFRSDGTARLIDPESFRTYR